MSVAADGASKSKTVPHISLGRIPGGVFTSDSGAGREIAKLAAGRLPHGGEVGSWRGEMDDRVEPHDVERVETVHDPVR